MHTRGGHKTPKLYKHKVDHRKHNKQGYKNCLNFKKPYDSRLGACQDQIQFLRSRHAKCATKPIHISQRDITQSNTLCSGFYQNTLKGFWQFFPTGTYANIGTTCVES